MITATQYETDPYILTKKTMHGGNYSQFWNVEAIQKMICVEVVIDHLLDILIK